MIAVFFFVCFCLFVCLFGFFFDSPGMFIICMFIMSQDHFKEKKKYEQKPSLEGCNKLRVWQGVNLTISMVCSEKSY